MIIIKYTIITQLKNGYGRIALILVEFHLS